MQNPNPREEAMTIGENLKRARMKRELSQAALLSESEPGKART
ncbi:hypothetical protein CSC30_0007 [Pseudomonas aeruginosa]|nr:hypothetical protein CSC30_0007 [Pseudomonas aeruginosa]